MRHKAFGQLHSRDNFTLLKAVASPFVFEAPNSFDSFNFASLQRFPATTCDVLQVCQHPVFFKQKPKEKKNRNDLIKRLGFQKAFRKREVIRVRFFLRRSFRLHSVCPLFCFVFVFSFCSAKTGSAMSTCDRLMP